MPGLMNACRGTINLDDYITLERDIRHATTAKKGGGPTEKKATIRSYYVSLIDCCFHKHRPRLLSRQGRVSVNSAPKNTARTELHSMITFHHAKTRGSRAGRLRIAHLLCP